MCYSWNFYKIDSFLKPVLNIIVFCKIIVGGGGGGGVIKKGGGGGGGERLLKMGAGI